MFVRLVMLAALMVLMVAGAVAFSSSPSSWDRLFMWNYLADGDNGFGGDFDFGGGWDD